MDIILKVETEVLKSKASEVTGYVDGLETHFNSIYDIVTRSSGYWVGAAGEKARTEFNNQKENTDQVIRRFREHPEDLLAMAGIYDKMEQAVVTLNKTLSTDVIL